MLPLAPADVLLFSLVGLAALRGVWIGLVREVLSLTALAGIAIALRFGTAPVAARVGEWSGLGPLAARIAAGALLVAVTLALFAALRAAVRRGVQAAGLGLWDRLLGGALGAAEGVLVGTLVLLGAIALLGREHPWIEPTRSLAALERLEDLTRPDARSPRDVAAPPRR